MLRFQFAANPRARALGEGGGRGKARKGTRFESYITCYVAHLNDNVMCYIDFQNSYITCHVTGYITTNTCYLRPLLHNRFLFSYITCYIQSYILVVNCICKMFYYYINFSSTWYITCYICCIVLLCKQSGILLQTYVTVHGMQNEGVENLHNDDIFEVGEDLIPLKQAMDDCAFKDRVSTLILCDGWVDEK